MHSGTGLGPGTTTLLLLPIIFCTAASCQDPDGAPGPAATAGTGPLITRVTPALVPTTGGTPIAIAGQGFPPDATVLVAGQAAGRVLVLSPTLIEAEAPPRPGQIGAADVEVRGPGGAADRRGDLLRYYYGEVRIFPAQWDPKLGIHVT